MVDRGHEAVVYMADRLGREFHGHDVVTFPETSAVANLDGVGRERIESMDANENTEARQTDQQVPAAGLAKGRRPGKPAGRVDEGDRTPQTQKGGGGTGGGPTSEEVEAERRRRLEIEELNHLLARKGCPHCATVGFWSIDKRDGRIVRIRCKGCGKYSQVPVIVPDEPAQPEEARGVQSGGGRERKGER